VVLMRQKRTHPRPATDPHDGPPPGGAGQTIDWMGAQVTGSGGATMEAAGIVAGLAVLLAVPYLAWKVLRRSATAGRSGRS